MQLQADIFRYAVLICFCIGMMMASGCNEDQPDHHVVRKPAKMVGFVDFLLNDTLVVNDPVVQYDGDQNRAVMFSPQQRCFVFYASSGGDPLKIIKFDKEGPDGIGNWEEYGFMFRIVGHDTIYLLNIEKEILFKLCISNASVVERIVLHKKYPELGTVRATAGKLLAMYNSTLYIKCYPKHYRPYDEQNIRSESEQLIYALPIDSGEIDRFGTIPALYYSGIWGQQLSDPIYIVDAERQLTYLSFPLSDSVYAYTDTEPVSTSLPLIGSMQLERKALSSISKKADNFIMEEYKTVLRQHQFINLLQYGRKNEYLIRYLSPCLTDEEIDKIALYNIHAVKDYRNNIGLIVKCDPSTGQTMEYGIDNNLVVGNYCFSNQDTLFFFSPHNNENSIRYAKVLCE